MKDVYYRPDDLKRYDLIDMIGNMKENRTAEGLLYLTLLIRRETMQNKTIFFVDDNALVACFNHGITEDLVPGWRSTDDQATASPRKAWQTQADDDRRQLTAVPPHVLRT